MNKLKGKFGTTTNSSTLDGQIDKTSDAMANFRSAVIRNMMAHEKVDSFVHPRSDVQKMRSRFIERHVQLESGKAEADYSLEDLAFALSIYRNCGNLPPIWTSFLVMPSKSVMAGLLIELIPSKPGFDEILFAVIEAEAKQLDNDERSCMILFDEIVICPNLSREEDDIVLGFEDFGYRRGKDIATHAQVFMLTNLKRKWTHPAFYSFSYGQVKSEDIIRILKLIVRRCSGIGLQVIATVCDHKPNNVKAINTLLEATKESRIRAGIDDRPDTTIEFNGQEVIPCYDVKKMFTGIRNNFLTSNIHFVDQNVEKIAKWEHIKKMYEMPKEIKLSEKLTAKHVYPEKIDKRDAVTSLQVFSYKVATDIFFYATQSQLTSQQSLSMPPDAVQTSALLRFLDQLYDSLNDCDSKPDESKPFRSTATVGSPHLEFWEDAVAKLETFKFEKQGTYFRSPALQCLNITTKNFVYLFKKLQKQNVTTLNQHKLSLEKLEKFMQKVTRGRIPTAERFVRHYHFTRVHSFLGGNPVCKRYDGAEKESKVFDTLQKLLLKEFDEDVKVEKFTKIPGLEFFGVQDYPLDRKLVSTLSEFVAESCTNNCRKIIFEKIKKITKDPKDNRFVKTFQVNLQFSDQVRNACTLIKFILGKDMHKRGVLTHIMDYVSSEIQFTNCEHAQEISKIILNHLIKSNTEKYIGQINDVLKGKYSKNLPTNSSAYLKRAAEMNEKCYGKRLNLLHS